HSQFNRHKIEDAPLLVVFSVYSNLAKFEEQITHELPQPNVDYYNNVVKPQGEEAISCWLKNQLYISMGVLLSGCAAMGLDSTPMEGIEQGMYDSILANTDYSATVAVAIGYRSIEDTNQPEIHPKQRLKMDDVVVMKK
ncbi:MAG: NAD(P)H-dependent oxidoreductase, partial [Rikenellaceae bacterium]